MDVTKEFITYERSDGVNLTATVYLPSGYNKERDGRLPVLVWAYPREFKSAQQLLVRLQVHHIDLQELDIGDRIYAH